MADVLMDFDGMQFIADEFLSHIDEIEASIVKRLMEHLDTFDTAGGKFLPGQTTPAKLVEIEKQINAVLKKAGYFEAANLFILDLAKITENTRQLHSEVNSLQIQKKSLTGIEKVYTQNAVNLLSEGGLHTNFVMPVTVAISEAVTFGYSIAKTRDTLTQFQNSPSKYTTLKSYLTTTARDTVSQLQGAQHQAISTEFKMPLVRYVGGLLKDSRGQCVKWHSMQYLPVKDLQALINEAFANQAAKLDQPKGHKWSGMIKDTTPENFLIRRGGWGCLHNAIPVRKKA
jgi:hypothetical protein